MRRIKEISRKPSGKRKRNPVVYLICEGTETEIRYFKKFRSRGCHIDIIPLPSQYKSADSLVQKAKATMGNNIYYPEDGDIIWCVFDRDENTDAMLQKAAATASREGYRIAFSNPAFEVWFLYHFIDCNAELADSKAVIRLLDQPGRLEKYAKSKDVYAELKPLQNTAIERAKKRVAALEVPVLSRASNPATTVAELVEFLNSKQ